MDPDAAVLARCVGDVDVFARDHWGRRPLVHRGAVSFGDLLDIDAVEELLAATARRPTFRLVRDGETLAPQDYTAKVRMAGTTVDDAADITRIAEHVAAGATLVLQGLQRTWLPLARFCRSLERTTSHAVQANAYLTPPGAAGLGRHADGHEVLVLQVAGSKEWDIEGIGELRLAAGDVLYLPTGTAHAAAAQQEMSLHLTVGLLADTWRNAIGRALAAAGSDADLEGPLPLGYARPGHEDELADGLRAAFDRAAKFLGDLDVGDRAAAEARRAVRRRRPLGISRLASVLALPGLDGTTRVRIRADNPARITDEPAADGRLVFELIDRRLLLPAHTRPALERLLTGDEAAVADLPGLSEEGRVVLARRLVREGVLDAVTGMLANASRLEQP